METGRDSVMFPWQHFRSLLESSFGGEIMFNSECHHSVPLTFTNVLLHLVVFKVFQSIDLRVRKAWAWISASLTIILWPWANCLISLFPFRLIVIAMTACSPQSSPALPALILELMMIVLCYDLFKRYDKNHWIRICWVSTSQIVIKSQGEL